MFTIKQSNILKRLNISDISGVESYFSKFSAGDLLYPSRVAAELHIPTKKIDELLFLLVLEKKLKHVTVPMRNTTKKVYDYESDYVTDGIVLKFEKDFEVLDDSYNEIPHSQLTPLIAFKVI